MYKFIYQLSPFKFNFNSMIWWEENDVSIKSRLITIASTLVRRLNPTGDVLLVDQTFLL